MLKPKRYGEAIECYGKVIEINPNDERAWFEKGTLLNGLRRDEEAIECYDKVIEINPNNEHALSFREYILNISKNKIPKNKS
jgi:tetratricopeptide (TPR) repeat protein